MSELIKFLKMQKNLEQQYEAMELGISEDKMQIFMDFPEEERENVLASLRYMKKTGKDRL